MYQNGAIFDATNADVIDDVVLLGRIVECSDQFMEGAI